MTSPPFFQLFVLQFDPYGKHPFKPAIPNDPTLDGLLLYWQGIEAPGAVNIGEVTSFAFYKQAGPAVEFC